MKPEISSELPEDNIEATANAFAIAFMSLPAQVKSRFFEIIKERKGEKRNRAERLEAFKERRRQEQQEKLKTPQEASGAHPIQKPINKLSKSAQSKQKSTNNKQPKKKRQAQQTPGITAAEAMLIKFRSLNPQDLDEGQSSKDKSNKEFSKPYKAQSKLISSGARLCELCGKYHQGNTCY